MKANDAEVLFRVLVVYILQIYVTIIYNCVYQESWDVPGGVFFALASSIGGRGWSNIQLIVPQKRVVGHGKVIILNQSFLDRVGLRARKGSIPPRSGVVIFILILIPLVTLLLLLLLILPSSSSSGPRLLHHLHPHPHPDDTNHPSSKYPSTISLQRI